MGRMLILLGVIATKPPLCVHKAPALCATPLGLRATAPCTAMAQDVQADGLPAPSGVLGHPRHR